MQVKVETPINQPHIHFQWLRKTSGYHFKPFGPHLFTSYSSHVRCILAASFLQYTWGISSFLPQGFSDYISRNSYVKYFVWEHVQSGSQSQHPKNQILTSRSWELTYECLPLLSCRQIVLRWVHPGGIVHQLPAVMVNAVRQPCS